MIFINKLVKYIILGNKQETNNKIYKNKVKIFIFYILMIR